MDLNNKEDGVGKIEVLVPISEVKVKKIRMAKRPLNFYGKIIGFLWNRKPNGNLLLRNLEEALKQKYQLRGTLMKEKPLSSSEASPEVLEELSAKCDFVVLAIGD